MLAVGRTMCRPDPALQTVIACNDFQTQRLSLRVAIIAAEARAGAHTALLMDRILHGQDTDETEQGPVSRNGRPGGVACPRKSAEQG